MKIRRKRKEESWGLVDFSDALKWMKGGGLATRLKWSNNAGGCVRVSVAAHPCGTLVYSPKVTPATPRVYNMRFVPTQEDMMARDWLLLVTPEDWILLDKTGGDVIAERENTEQPAQGERREFGGGADGVGHEDSRSDR